MAITWVLLFVAFLFVLLGYFFKKAKLDPFLVRRHYSQFRNVIVPANTGFLYGDLEYHEVY